MKIKNLLILSVVALLAGCGQQAPATYNTTVNLPDGGNEVAETEKDKKAGDTIQEVVGDVNTLNSIGGEINVDISSSNVVNHNYDGVTMSSSTEVSMKGNVKFNLIHSTLKSSRSRVFSSKMSFVFKNFSMSMLMKSNGQVASDVKLNNLTFGIHYLYDGAGEEGFFLVDLSDPSMKTTIEQFAYQSIDANPEMPDEAKSAAKAAMSANLTKYLVTNGGKFYAKQQELVTFIQQMMSQMSGSGSGVVPTRAVDDPTETIMQLLEGNIVANILNMLKERMPEDPSASIASVLPRLLEALPYLFKEYKNDAGVVVQYGLGFNINQDNAKEFIAMVISGIESMMGGSDSAIVPTTGTLEDAETEPTEEAPALPDGLKLSLGFALMLGKTHGSTTIELESISARFSIDYPPSIKAQGALSLDLYYGEQVADLIGDTKGYTINLVQVIQELMSGGQPDPTTALA